MFSSEFSTSWQVILQQYMIFSTHVTPPKKFGPSNGFLQ
jgi:hypothetical protein